MQYPFLDEVLGLKPGQQAIHIIRGQAFVIRPAADDDFDTCVVYDEVEQPRGEGPR